MSEIEIIKKFVEERLEWNESMKKIDPKPSDIGRIEEDKCILRYIEKIIKDEETQRTHMRYDGKNIRIGDLEVRRTAAGCAHPYEIVRWQAGRVFDEKGPKETCCVLAWITKDCDILSVGYRPWDQPKGDIDEFNDFIIYLFEENKIRYDD